MWTCSNCQEIVDDDAWETCWNCGRERSPSDPAAAQPQVKSEPSRGDFNRCLRCQAPMVFAGRRQFHEGPRLGFWLGDLGELFVNREALVIYACKVCGRVDFYIDGIGNDLRGDPPAP